MPTFTPSIPSSTWLIWGITVILGATNSQQFKVGRENYGGGNGGGNGWAEVVASGRGGGGGQGEAEHEQGRVEVEEGSRVRQLEVRVRELEAELAGVSAKACGGGFEKMSPGDKVDVCVEGWGSV